jgi:hypothetical protein
LGQPTDWPSHAANDSAELHFAFLLYGRQSATAANGECMSGRAIDCVALPLIISVQIYRIDRRLSADMIKPLSVRDCFSGPFS